LLSWSGDNTLRLWDGATGAALAKLEGHTESVNGALALPDGRLLSWSSDYTLRLWDGATGAALVTLEGHTDWVSGALALPDGRLLSWSQDKTLRLWDGDTGAALATLEGHRRSVDGALALPDGRLLSWSVDGTLRLWDGATGVALVTLEGHTDSVNGAAVLQDGIFLSWSRDGTLRLWDNSGGSMGILGVHYGEVVDVTVLADGRVLSCSRRRLNRYDEPELPETMQPPNAVMIFDRASDFGAHRTLVMLTNAEFIWATSLPDGRLLSWSYDHTLRLWDGVTGAQLHCVDQTEVQHTHPDLYLAWRTAVSPDAVHQHTVAQGNARGLTLNHAGHTTRWHADGAWTADHLLPDGTIIAHCGKHLAILHLHHGNRRVSIKEAESLSVAAQSAPSLSPSPQRPAYT
jgi:WD40 repeat protein